MPSKRIRSVVLRILWIFDVSHFESFVYVVFVVGANVKLLVKNVIQKLLS